MTDQDQTITYVVAVSAEACQTAYRILTPYGSLAAAVAARERMKTQFNTPGMKIFRMVFLEIDERTTSPDPDTRPSSTPKVTG